MGADTPAWLMQAIIMDRVIEDEPLATDAEVTAYLMSRRVVCKGEDLNAAM